MRSIILIIGGLVFSAAVNSKGNPAIDQMRTRDDVEEKVSQMLDQNDFKGLNALESGLRKTEKVSTSGFLMLPFFYYGLDNYFQSALDSAGKTEAVGNKLKSWVDNYPSEPAGHIAFAKWHKNQAWYYRGGGYANTVTPSQWKLFDTYLEQARSHLVTHANVASASPEWYSELVVIYNQHSFTKMEKNRLLWEVIKRHPKYSDLYVSGFVSYLPRWGGTMEQAEEFLGKATKSLNPRDGDLMFSAIYLATMHSDQISAPRLKSDCDRMVGGASLRNRLFPSSFNQEEASFALKECQSTQSSK